MVPSVARSVKSFHSCAVKSPFFSVVLRNRDADRTMARTLCPLASACGIRCWKVREVPLITAMVCGAMTGNDMMDQDGKTRTWS